MFAQSFDEQFENWFIEGSTSTIVYTVMVLLIVAVVIRAVSR